MHDCLNVSPGLGIYIMRMLPLLSAKIAKKTSLSHCHKNWVLKIPAFVIAHIVIIRIIGQVSPKFAHATCL